MSIPFLVERKLWQPNTYTVMTNIWMVETVMVETAMACLKKSPFYDHIGRIANLFMVVNIVYFSRTLDTFWVLQHNTTNHLYGKINN